MGRFGWKAGQARIAEQAAAAMAGSDIGIANGDPIPPATARRRRACMAAPTGATARFENEATSEVMELVSYYSRHLAVPTSARSRRARGARRQAPVLRGRLYRLPHAQARDRARRPDPALRGQLIWPYTDLLHDMGEGLADGRPEGVADGQDERRRCGASA